MCVHPRSLLPEMPSVTGDVHALGRLRNGAQANLPEFSRGADGEGVCGAAGVGGDCEARGGNAVSAGGGDGVKRQGLRDLGLRDWVFTCAAAVFSAVSRVPAMISEPLAVGWMPSCWIVPGTWTRSL